MEEEGEEGEEGEEVGGQQPFALSTRGPNRK